MHCVVLGILGETAIVDKCLRESSRLLLDLK